MNVPALAALLGCGRSIAARPRVRRAPARWDAFRSA